MCVDTAEIENLPRLKIDLLTSWRYYGRLLCVLLLSLVVERDSFLGSVEMILICWRLLVRVLITSWLVERLTRLACASRCRHLPLFAFLTLSLH